MIESCLRSVLPGPAARHYARPSPSTGVLRPGAGGLNELTIGSDEPRARSRPDRSPCRRKRTHKAVRAALDPGTFQLVPIHLKFTKVGIGKVDPLGHFRCFELATTFDHSALDELSFRQLLPPPPNQLRRDVQLGSDITRK